MKVKRRWNCPNCGRLYTIGKSDEIDIAACIEYRGFALRTCPRCAYVITITPREDTGDGTGKGTDREG